MNLKSVLYIAELYEWTEWCLRKQPVFNDYLQELSQIAEQTSVGLTVELWVYIADIVYIP